MRSSSQIIITRNPEYQHPAYHRPDALLVAQSTMSKHWGENYHIPWTWSLQAHWGGGELPTLCLTAKNSWLLWGSGLPLAKPLVSTVTPVPLSCSQIVVLIFFKVDAFAVCFFYARRVFRWSVINDVYIVGCWHLLCAVADDTNGCELL